MSKNDPIIDREKLYEEVWSEPVTTAAKRYGLSDVGLAKICKKLAIPLPSRGYWAKVHAGKKMKRVPLPKLIGDGPSKSPAPLAVKLSVLSTEEQEARASAKLKASTARKAAQSVVQSSNLIDPHPLVAAAKKRLQRKNGWNSEKGLRSAPDEVLDIEVTESSLDRALLIMDNLIKKLNALSVTVKVVSTSKQTVLDVEGTVVELKISEYVRRTNHEETPDETKARERYWNRNRWDSSISYPRIPRYDYHPTGIMTVQAGRWFDRKWNDTPRTFLEDRLDEIVADIFVLAAKIKEKNDEDARREERRRLAEERYAFLSSRLENERKLLNQLEADAANWERANRIRSYVAAFEREVFRDNDLTPELKDWLAWARAKANGLDPLVLVSDPILDAPELKRPSYW